MQHKKIIFLALQVADKENSADYQRVSLLARVSRLTTITASNLPGILSGRVYQSFVYPKTCWIICALWKLRNQNKDKNPPIIYSSPNLHSLIVVYLANKLFGYQYVIDFWDHPSLQYEMTGRLVKFVKSNLWKYLKSELDLANRSIVAMSPRLVETFKTNSECKYSVGRGVTFPAVSSNIKEKFCGDELRFVNVGWLYRIRGTDFFTSLLSELEARGVKATIRSAGYSDSYSRKKILLHNQVCLNKIEDLGFLDKNEVSSLYAWGNFGLCILDTSVLNYKYAYPIKVYEYMANSVVNIASSTLGTSEMIKHNSNGIVLCGDTASQRVSDLCDILLQINKSNWLRLVDNGKDTVRSKTIESLEVDLVDIYRRMKIL